MITSPQGDSISKAAVLFVPEFSLYASFALCFILYVDKMKKSFFSSKVGRRKFGPRNLKLGITSVSLSILLNC